MTALATSTDVVAVLGRALTATETAKLAAALDAASAVVREITGRRYEVGSAVTVRRCAQDGRVWLDNPSSVTSVSRICDDGSVEALSGYTLRGSTIYGLGCDGWVEVVYASAGTIPAEVVSVVAEMVARRLTSTVPQGATAWSETKGPFSESASFAAPTDTISPTATEAKVLRRHALLRTTSVNLL